MTEDDLNNRFTYHPPADPGMVALYQDVRDRARNYAHFLNDNVPESREKSLAVTHLEDTVFWANAAIARHTKPPVEEE